MNSTNPPFSFLDPRWGKPTLVWPVVRSYPSGQLAIQLMSNSADENMTFEEPWATATVALPGDPPAPGHAWMKTWSENINLVPLLIQAGIVMESEPTRVLHLGYDAFALEYPLTTAFLEFVNKEL